MKEYNYEVLEYLVHKSKEYLEWFKKDNYNG